MHDDQAIREAYSKAVPLSDVFDRFSPDARKRAYGYARKRDAAKTKAQLLQTAVSLRESQTKAFQKRLTDYYRNDLSGVNTSINPYSELHPSRYPRLLATQKPNASKYEADLHEAIWRGVLNGKYLVLGYELPRKVSDPPVFVPDDVWRQWSSIDWRKSRVNGNGLKFEAVRLLPQSWLVNEASKEDASQSSAKPVAAKRTRRGPQSREVEVVSAYRVIFERGEIEKGESYKSVWNKVRAKIERDTDDPKRLEYTTVLPFLKKLH